MHIADRNTCNDKVILGHVPMLQQLKQSTSNWISLKTNPWTILQVFHEADDGNKGYLNSEDVKVATAEILGYKPSKVAQKLSYRISWKPL